VSATAPLISANILSASKAMEALTVQSKTPIFKDNPMPPVAVPDAPAQLAAVKEQQEVLDSVKQNLIDQQLTAKGGQSESKAVIDIAKEHQKGADHAVQEVTIHKATLDKDKGDVQKGKQKVAEGKTQQEKGAKGLDKTKSEGDRGKNAVPNSRVNRDEVPWYKKVFMWVVDKFEGAKTAVSQAMTNVIMKIVEGALPMDKIKKEMAGADESTKKQESTLNQEPAVLGQVTTVAQKESAAARQGEQKAQQRLADNIKAEQEATKSIQQTKAQQAKLQAEEAAIKANAAKYEATYGPSFKTLDLHSKAAGAKDLTPMNIPVDPEVQLIQQGVAALVAAIGQHKGQVEGEANRLGAQIRGDAGSKMQKDEQKSEAGSQADKLVGQAVGGAGKSAQDRIAKVQLIGQAAAGLTGKAAKRETLIEVARLHGELKSEAEAFDQAKDQELQDMHRSFSTAYAMLFG